MRHPNYSLEEKQKKKIIIIIINNKQKTEQPQKWVLAWTVRQLSLFRRSNIWFTSHKYLFHKYICMARMNERYGN